MDACTVVTASLGIYTYGYRTLSAIKFVVLRSLKAPLGIKMAPSFSSGCPSMVSSDLLQSFVREP